jgi:hypothetical protein
MSEPQKLEQIKLFLDQEDYQNAIALLEKHIAEDPDELTYYWYLGLAYRSCSRPVDRISGRQSVYSLRRVLSTDSGHYLFLAKVLFLNADFYGF